MYIWERGGKRKGGEEGEGKEEKEGSRSGHREQLNGDAVSVQGSADTIGSSGPGVTLQRCPESRQED